MLKKKIRNITKPLLKFSKAPSLWLLPLLLITGCTTLKKAAIVAGGAGVGATAGSLLSGGALAPAAGAVVTAAVADIATEGMSTMSDCPAVNADTVVQTAPDNIWSLLQALTEWGGIGLLIFLGATYLIPLLIGYLVPNGFEKKKKRR